MSKLNEKVQEILKTSGLDFRIEKLPMSATINSTVVDGDGLLTKVETKIESDYFGLYNTKVGKIINTVKEGYTVSQNEDIVKLVLMGIEGFGDKLTIKNAGSINDGRKVYLQLGIKGVGLVNGDVIEKYITIIDSNDGSTGLSVGIGDLTMSCQNQFYRFYKSGQSKMRHTESIEGKMLELPYLINNALEESFLQIEKYKQLSTVKIDDTVANRLVKHLIGVDRTETDKEISTRLKSSMDTLYNMIAIETAQKGRNAWGLHSGVTRWTTHHKSAPKRGNGRIESQMLGTNYATNQKSFDFTLELL
jgi:hypothetical protein